MKKILIASAVAGLAMSGSAFAGSQFASTDYLKKDGSVSVGVGMAEVAGLDDSAVVVTGAYEKGLDAVLPGLSVGVDAAFSVVDAEDEVMTVDVEAGYWAVGSYAKYSYGLDRLVPNLSVNGKVGVAFAEYEVNSVEFDDTDLVLGAGAAYALDGQTSVTADYTDYDGAEQVTVGVKYAF